MAPQTSRKELTQVEKSMILAFFEIFQKISTVSQVVGRPWSTVRNFLARSLTQGSIENLPRSGQPPLVSQKVKRSLVRGARVHRDWTREKLWEISVRYGGGGGGFSLARPRPYTGPGGYVSGNPCPAPVRSPPTLIPWTGPVCYHLFLTGTRLGYGWGGGLSGDRGRECGKRHTAPGR